MKIYIPDIIISRVNEERIAEYYKKSGSTSLIISTDGILKIKDSEISRLRIRDVHVTESSIGTFRVLLDDSKWEFDESWFQIPTEHIHETTIKKEYILRKGALVSLIVEERNMENVDFYFSTNEDIEMMGIRDDILTFLSQLKFC
tara:strand:+ start:979 stop:1413 length:435 start_codon:yes stop_codon:yes gene_type:complete